MKRPIPFLLAALAVTHAATPTLADAVFSGPATYTAEVGAWWTPFFETGSSEPAKNWTHTRYNAYHDNNSGQAALGRYDSAWLPTIDRQIADMKSVGIDFVLADLTNGVGNGMPQTELLMSRGTMPVAAAIGGPLWFPGLSTAEVQRQTALEVDSVVSNLLSKPNYVGYRGKPLLVTYMNYDQGKSEVALSHWDDPRFEVQRATGRVVAGDPALDFESNGYDWDAWWGWLSESQVTSPTAMLVSPGFDTEHFRGDEGFRKSRRDGEVYIQQWLNAIRTDPEFVIISSWNDHNEETHIEPSDPVPGSGAPGWEDLNGFQTSTLYTQLTKAYTALQENILLEGFYYSDESSPDIFRLNGSVLDYVGSVSQIAANSAIVRLPDDLLTQIRTSRTLSSSVVPEPSMAALLAAAGALLATRRRELA